MGMFILKFLTQTCRKVSSTVDPASDCSLKGFVDLNESCFLAFLKENELQDKYIGDLVVFENEFKKASREKNEKEVENAILKGLDIFKRFMNDSPKTLENYNSFKKEPFEFMIAQDLIVREHYGNYIIHFQNGCMKLHSDKSKLNLAARKLIKNPNQPVVYTADDYKKLKELMDAFTDTSSGLKAAYEDFKKDPIDFLTKMVKEPGFITNGEVSQESIFKYLNKHYPSSNWLVWIFGLLGFLAFVGLI